MARPRLEIDPAKVEDLAAIGATTEEIAAFMNCSRDTIERRFAANLAKGKESGRTRLRMLQWQKAKALDTAMLIWLGKQHLGQSDKLEQSGRIQHEHFNADEETILAAAEEIRFRRLVGDAEPVEPLSVHEGDVSGV